MPNMTIHVPEDLKSAIDEHPEINWSRVARQSMWEYVHKLNVADSLTAKSGFAGVDVEDLSEAVKADIAKHYDE